jgi:cellulose synthase/poly-beta-1,6-N-acetylglucosamine synthase-like glycosyltransferase
MDVLILTIVFSIVCGAIVLAHLVMYVGLLASAILERRGKRKDNHRNLSVTVIVPARDEEKLLGRLLESLDAQTRKDIQVILVDDRSKDRTGKIMADYARNHSNATVLTLTDAPLIGNPKLNALIAGVKAANGEILMFTDADCITPTEWVEEISGRFKDDRIGVILGPIETRKTHTLLSTFHAFDHAFKYSYTAGCAGIGVPTGGFGNNLSVRKKTIEEIGGLESIEVTSTEDAALISRVRAMTPMKTRALFSRSVAVLTEPQISWKALTEQEIRWHTGGLFSPDLQTRFAYGFIMIYLTVSVLTIPACFFIPALSILPVVSLVTMSLMAVIAGFFTSQPPLSYWCALIPFIILSMGYNSYLTIKSLLRPKLFWKGTRLHFSKR